MLYIIETNNITSESWPHNKDHSLDASLCPIPESFNSGCSIINDAHFYCDARQFMTKENKLFCYKVREAISRGLNIILITSSASLIDKRLRSKAVILTVPSVLDTDLQEE